MDYLPMFARLEGRPVLLVGGGEVALRKARLLLAAGARITLVSPAIEPEFHEFAGRFTHVAARFDPAHLAGQILVVAATDDLEVNALVYQSATERGLFVNLVDDPERSSFIFPSIIDRSPIVVAVSSGGKAPVLVRLLRERLESLLPRHLGGLAELSGRVRRRAKQVLASLSDRRRFWERAFASNTLAGLIEKADWQGAEQWLNEGLDKAQTEVGEVVLVGAGPGDPGLLTLKALQQIQQAEVVLYDQLVSPEILDLVRRDATLVSVGKKAGAHSVPQEETNRLLVEYAKAGNRVVRLKGGDPFMFGRGGEELEVLADEGIPFSVVPGITAAAGAIGAFIYVPQFLASVVTMEVVPSFAVGSAVGLRGFMSYIVGTTMGTALIGKLVDLYGWSAGFYTLLTGAVLAIVFGVLSHLGSLELEAKKQADLAKADTLDAGDVATAGARA